MKEAKIEYVKRHLGEDRIQTIKSISDESGVSLRSIGYIMKPEGRKSEISAVTINKLHQYFKSKGRE